MALGFPILPASPRKFTSCTLRFQLSSFYTTFQKAILKRIIFTIHFRIDKITTFGIIDSTIQTTFFYLSKIKNAYP
jgi:hypothetical protein